jgi:cytochrome c oxidase assembly protein subunit 15
MNNAKIIGPHAHALHWFAVLTAVATFLLLGIGGLVTSHEAGMSVPDWPTSFGYNMYALPIKFWRGGVFYEHTHRLFASVIGCMTIMLAVWLWLKDPRKWMKWLGVTAVIVVSSQGVVGGLRVVLSEDQLGIVHGVIAQVFFILMSAIALFTSGFWKQIAEGPKINVPSGLRTLVLATTVLIFGQLVIGATMRHQHAGLSINTFPSAYGKLWPDTAPDAIARYNANRMEITNINPITAFQVILQMVHRMVALAIFIFVALCAAQAWRNLGKSDALTKLAAGWLAMIVAQIGLGAATIWTNKAADVATAHVLVGALSLVTGALWCLIAFGRTMRVPATSRSAGEAFGALGTFAGNK